MSGSLGVSAMNIEVQAGLGREWVQGLGLSVATLIHPLISSCSIRETA